MRINWIEGTTPVSELSLVNFPDFARDFADHTYRLCYKASLDEKLAKSLSQSVLAAVICQESGKEGSDSVMPEQAIKSAMLDIMTKQQLTRLNNDSIKTDVEPKQRDLDEIVEKAVEKANAQMPRYARSFTGTNGTLVIIGIVAVVIVAIVLIWTNPLACTFTEKGASGGKTGPISAAARPNPDILIDVDFDTSAGSRVNSGVVPVMLSLNGPDANLVTGVAAFASDGTQTAVYPCGAGRYCFAAEKTDVYKVVVSDGGSQLAAYKSVAEIAGEGEEGLPEARYYVLSHNGTLELPFDGSTQIITEPSKGELRDNDGVLTYVPGEGADGIGIDVFSYDMGDGAECCVPIIVSNHSPFVEPTCLSAAATHTPTRSGMLAGRLSVSDEDGDGVAFSLLEQKGCTVLISPNGSYVVLFEPDYRAPSASFSFSVTDGIVTSDPYTVDILLQNNLIAAAEINKSFVCYSGANGYYDIELPRVDEDGDPITWALVTQTADGLTAQWRSEIRIEDDGHVRYRIDPSRNEAFTEILTFSCSDGWMSGGTATVICSNLPNLPPVSSGENSAPVVGGTASVLEVTVKDDCIFDVCRIASVESVTGGTVVPDEGWNEMRFTFTPDGTLQYCQVQLTVEDIVTGERVPIVYDIFVG